MRYGARTPCCHTFPCLVFQGPLSAAWSIWSFLPLEARRPWGVQVAVHDAADWNQQRQQDAALQYSTGGGKFKRNDDPKSLCLFERFLKYVVITRRFENDWILAWLKHQKTPNMNILMDFEKALIFLGNQCSVDAAGLHHLSSGFYQLQSISRRTNKGVFATPHLWDSSWYGRPAAVPLLHARRGRVHWGSALLCLYTAASLLDVNNSHTWSL